MDVKKSFPTALCAGIVAAASFAGPPTASAEGSAFNGTYTVQYGDGASSVWTVSSDCETEGCVARVISSKGWDRQFTMTNGRWVGSAFTTRAYHCAFFQWHDGDVVYSVDPVTMTGVFTVAPNPYCSPPPVSFTLSGGAGRVPAPAQAPAPAPAPDWRPPTNLPGFEGIFPPGVNPSTGMPQDPNISITGG